MHPKSQAQPVRHRPSELDTNPSTALPPHHLTTPHDFTRPSSPRLTSPRLTSTHLASPHLTQPGNQETIVAAVIKRARWANHKPRQFLGSHLASLDGENDNGSVVR